MTTNLITAAAMPAGASTRNVTISATQNGVTITQNLAVIVTAGVVQIVGLTLTPAVPAVADNVPNGTVVASIAVLTQNNVPFTGTLGFTSPNNNDGGRFSISGSNLVVAAPMPGGSSTRNVTILATQGAQTFSASFGITVNTTAGVSFPAIGSSFVTPAGTTMHLAFSDEFTGVAYAELNGALFPDRTKWRNSFAQGDSVRTLTGNGEAQYYMDPWYVGINPGAFTYLTRPNPFSFRPGAPSGILQIHSFTNSTAVQNNYWMGPGREYSSGMLGSAPVDINGNVIANQGYLLPKLSTGTGHWYIEGLIKLNHFIGSWPAFWTIAYPLSYPPEVDFFEFFGHRVLNGVPGAIHTNGWAGTSGETSGFQYVNHTFDLGAGFHTYGFQADNTNLTWFFDGAQTMQFATTPSMRNNDMYIILNAAVGGNWYAQEINNGQFGSSPPPGATKPIAVDTVDTTTMPWLALECDYIRAYT